MNNKKKLFLIHETQKKLMKSAKARVTGTIHSLWDGGRHTFLPAKTNFNFDINSSFVCSFCPSIFD
jgi:hypothetical protein